MTSIKASLAGMVAGTILSGVHPALAAVAVTDFSNGGSGNVYTGGGSGSQIIPDNNPSGVAYSINFGTTGLSISDITVSLQLSGGYNGDITAYLSHGTQIAYLLQASPAVGGSGFNLTFNEGTGTPVPTGGSGILTGNYVAATDLAAFNSTDPGGAWTLFFADLSPGDTTTLTGFSVGITTSAVPEPANAGLLIFGIVFVTTGFMRWRGKRHCAINV